MTDTTITVHGFDFSVTGDGFRNARDDFDKIADGIQKRLAGRSVTFVQNLHAGATMDQETGEVRDATAIALLDRWAVQITARILRKWAKPEGIFVTVYPV